MNKEALMKHVQTFKSLGQQYFKDRDKSNTSTPLMSMTLSELESHQNKFFEKYYVEESIPFHQYLRKLIFDKDKTNADIYKQANIDSSLFSKYLNGDRNPSMENLLRIIFALELSY